MTIRNIHHVACVVDDIEKGYAFWRDAVGLRVKKEAELPEQGVKAALLSMGNTEIELLQPIKADTGVDRYLQKTGGGMHHICFETEDVQGELDRVKERGVQLIDQQVRKGLAGDIFFVHPKATQGILVEFAQPEEPTHVGGREEAIFVDMPLICTTTGDLWKAAGEWERNFGLQVESYSISETLDNRHVMIPTGEKGSVYVEVLTPLSPTGKNAEFLQKRGESLFLMAARTHDMMESIRRLKDMGVRIAGEPEDGVVFIHPKSTAGVFIEMLPMVDVH